MIFLLLVQIQCSIVFVGFHNETMFIDPLKFEIDNANIQNFQDYEYITMNYHMREQLTSHAVREINENQFQMHDLWSLHNKRDHYKIIKITPYLNYKAEQIYEFTQKGLICLNLYVFEESFIIDCSNYINQSINLIEFNFINNKSNSINITSDFDNLRLSRKIYYSSDYLIILYKEIDNNIISIYDIKLKQQTSKWNKQNFDLPKLNIKKIIIQEEIAYILTKCEQLYKIYFKYSSQAEQICRQLQVYDIQEKIGVAILVFTKYHRYKLVEDQTCIEIQHTLNQPQMFQIFKDDEFSAYKYNFLNQLPEQLKNCQPFNFNNFYYNQQMLLCFKNYNYYQVILPTDRFQQVTISNNFYNTDKYSIVIRALESQEIIFIQSGEEFFPFIIYIKSDTIEVQHSKLFYGPNITYTLEAEYVQGTFLHYVEANIYNSDQCIYMDLLQFFQLENLFSFICQYQNKTTIITQNYSKQYFPYTLQYLYNLDIYLNSSYYIIYADSKNLEIINSITRQIRSFNSQNDNVIIETLLEHPIYFNCQLQIDYVECRKLPNLEKNFKFNLSYIKRLHLNQDIRFAYMPQHSFLLFLVSQNYVIVIHVDMIEDTVEKFQLVQLFQIKYEIKQLYQSNKILFVVCSNEGYLRILKYFEISPYYFKELGEIDCLGYQINNQIFNDNNGADDYYFVNSPDDVIIFKLSRSLQDSLQFVIPNAKFLKSQNYQFCLQQNYQVMCYNLVNNFSQLKIDLDKFKFSQIVPYEICAYNSKTKKCIKQNLKLLIRQQKLIINGYQLTQINSNEYKIDFDIKQGYIRDLSIIDGNAILIQNYHFLLQFNQTLIHFYESQDSILFSCSGQLLRYDKGQENIQKVQNISCLKAFMIGHHLLCLRQNIILVIYVCDQKWDCILKTELLVLELTYLMVSGRFILLKLLSHIKIIQYRPQNYNFNNIFMDERGSKFDFIQFINDYDFWFIRIKEEQILIHRFANLQLQIIKRFNYLERFNMDNQFTDKNDEIGSVLTLRHDYNSITLLFLMKLSSDKAYQISIIDDQIEVQCLFILFGDKPDMQEKPMLFSSNNDLLFRVTNINQVGVYNLSTNLGFHRNLIFNINLNLRNQTSAEQYIKRIYHFSQNQNIYLLVQTIKQTYLFQVDLNYKIKMIEDHQHTTVNLNRKNENILIKIEIPSLNQSKNYQYYVIIVLLIIGFIYRRRRLAK